MNDLGGVDPCVCAVESERVYCNLEVLGASVFRPLQSSTFPIRNHVFTYSAYSPFTRAS